MEEQPRTKQILALLKKYQFVLLMALVGLLLLMLPSFGAESGQDAPEHSVWIEEGYSLEQTQKDMETMLSQMDGVGRAKVMLTVSSGSLHIYQDDREVSYTGTSDNPTDYTSDSETVLLERGGDEEALQTQEIYPDYIGALVVCDGADRSGTVLKVKEAVSVLTGLGSDCISVVKREQS